jgi:rhodanese-related sulfurtransferase
MKQKSGSSMEQQLRRYIRNTKKDWNYITPLQFYEQYYLDKKKKDTFVLIDLRNKKEFEMYHIKGAKNIFWLDLLKKKNLDKLPRDKTIFLICYVGHTSSQAMVLLKLLGFEVVSIKFGYGVSPAFKIPVAGWMSYNLPVHRGQKTHPCGTKKPVQS